MALPFYQLESEALELTTRERARLAHRLLESLDKIAVEDPQEVEKAWAAEIERRLSAYRTGEMGTVDSAEVFAEARARLRER